MKRSKRKIKVGILGCGAIGSRIARSISKELKGLCTLTAVYDILPAKALNVAKSCSKRKIAQNSVENLIKKCNLMVEAVNSNNTRSLISQALKSRRNVLVMSAGKLLNANSLFNLATKNDCSLLIPSGAIAGIDAVKAASLAGIKSITLTTRKPPKGLQGNSYLEKKGINLSKVKKERIVFRGTVKSAVRHFPQNINVAATLALASQCPSKLKIKIVTSPSYKRNSHEIEIIGKSGRITTKCENVPSPSNPKTSYLAVLSGIQTLKDFCTGTRIGS